MKLQLFDPETPAANKKSYQEIVIPEQGAASHTKNGHGLLGDAAAGLVEGNKPKIVVMANRGCDLIYVPSYDSGIVKEVVTALRELDYVSGIFTSKTYGAIEGTLPLTSINYEDDLPVDALRQRELSGQKFPMPSIVVNFRTFATDLNHPFDTQVQFADTRLQQGQGMHGSFGRGDTFNFMTAFGPHFKAAFSDPAPASNADVAITLAQILGITLHARGERGGRVLNEALKEGPAPSAAKSGTLPSEPGGATDTYVKFQDLEQDGKSYRYFDSAGFKDRTVDAP